jgi:hypothetical protein
LGFSQPLQASEGKSGTSVTMNIVAFSLWGTNPMYWTGALRNVELAAVHYPGWVCRFYVSDESSVEQMRGLARIGAELIPVRRRHLFDGSFWRFLPASDPAVDVMISRDCDSRICERESAAVTEWLTSNKDFHLMRDHPYHRVPILGGMWGCRNHLLDNMEALVRRWTTFDRKGCDQDFLAAEIYPRVREESLEHSAFDISFGAVTLPFPTPRHGYEFVGEIFDENDVRDHEGWRVVRAHIDGP